MFTVELSGDYGRSSYALYNDIMWFDARLLVLLVFWPEARMHNGISSSADHIRELVPETTKDVVDNALLSIEQQR